MLVLEDGRIIGTIGGGCMESEVQHLCLRMLHEERAQGADLYSRYDCFTGRRGRARMWRYDPGIYGSNMISENCFVLYMPMILSGIRK